MLDTSQWRITVVATEIRRSEVGLWTERVRLREMKIPEMQTETGCV